MQIDTIELVGYTAMTVLVLSFIPKNTRWIRMINLVGCLFFVAYGILLGWKVPLIVSNGMIAIIQIYHLLSARREAK